MNTVLDTPTHTVTTKNDGPLFLVVKSANDYHARVYVPRAFGTDTWGYRCQAVGWYDTEAEASRSIMDELLRHDDLTEETDATFAAWVEAETDSDDTRGNDWYEGPGIYRERQLEMHAGATSGGYDVVSYRTIALADLTAEFSEAERLRLFEQSRAYFTVIEKEID